MREGLWLIQKKGNPFWLIKAYLRTPKRKKNKTSWSKQGKYVRISGAVRGHYLFQDANNSRERSSRKTVCRLGKLKKGNCIYIYKYTFVKAKLEIFVLKSVPFGTTSDTVVFWIYFHKKASWGAKSVNISKTPNLVLWGKPGQERPLERNQLPRV